MSQVFAEKNPEFVPIIETPWLDPSKQPEPEIIDKPILGDRYHTKEFMDQEWAKVWTKVWNIAGLASQIPNHGDFYTFSLGHEPLICTRDKHGDVRVYYNVCQHRGNKLVHQESGNSKALTCAYHGWRFNHEGGLIFAPCPEDFPQGNPCGKVTLKEVRSEVFAGFIWYSLDDNIVSLDEYIGPLKSQIDAYDMENMRRTHWVTVEGDFNWKIVQDNFCESYHLPYVHPQTLYIMEQSYKHCQFDLYEPHGHTRMFMPGGRPTTGLRGHVDKILKGLKDDIDFWGLKSEDFKDDPHTLREALQRAKREKGTEKGFDYSKFNDAQLTDHFHYTLFPSTSFSLKPDGCIWLRAEPHPTDPQKCIFDMWYFTWFPKGQDEYHANALLASISATDEVEHLVGKVGEVSTGPAIDQDVEIWNTQQQGIRSRGYGGGYMANQERRVKFFHQKIDEYLAK